ncbi:protein-disulfide reductase DsbD domain-containing protein [Acinetobacter indicus]|uniref:protein-disulfide reductase DsbD domain-containing protein n=1 Tax=Acinetobacter indicus TaxID=756892 RepID=UPI0022347BC4|nr:protein-disulfide reductase DsbD domain-containing protein [Acinetobacter indicus]
MPPSPARPWRCRRARPTADEFFGDVETYRKELLGTLTGTPAAGASATTLTVKYQGCADAGVCYPPQTRTLKVALPGEAGAGGFGCKARGLHDYVVKNGSADHPNAEVKSHWVMWSTP